MKLWHWRLKQTWEGPSCFCSTPQQGICKHQSNTACLISTLVTRLSYWRPLEIGLITYIVVVFTFYEQGLYLWRSSSLFLLAGPDEPCEHSRNNTSKHSCSDQPRPDLTGLLKIGCQKVLERLKSLKNQTEEERSFYLMQYTVSLWKFYNREHWKTEYKETRVVEIVWEPQIVSNKSLQPWQSVSQTSCPKLAEFSVPSAPHCFVKLQTLTQEGDTVWPEALLAQHPLATIAEAEHRGEFKERSSLLQCLHKILTQPPKVCRSGISWTRCCVVVCNSHWRIFFLLPSSFQAALWTFITTFSSKNIPALTTLTIYWVGEKLPFTNCEPAFHLLWQFLCGERK